MRSTSNHCVNHWGFTMGCQMWQNASNHVALSLLYRMSNIILDILIWYWTRLLYQTSPISYRTSPMSHQNVPHFISDMISERSDMISERSDMISDRSDIISEVSNIIKREQHGLLAFCHIWHPILHPSSLWLTIVTVWYISGKQLQCSTCFVYQWWVHMTVCTC